MKPQASHLGGFLHFVLFVSLILLASKPAGSEDPKGAAGGQVLLDPSVICGGSECRAAGTWEDGVCLLQGGWLESLAASYWISLLRMCELLLTGFQLDEACVSDSRDRERRACG